MAAGISGAWTAVLVVNFKPLGVDDKTGSKNNSKELGFLVKISGGVR